jgi:hypothetical protein
MGLSNAERQKRWREKRNDLAQDLLGTSNDICDAILRRLGVDQAKKVVRAGMKAACRRSARRSRRDRSATLAGRNVT